MQTEKISKRALSNKTGLQRKSILNWLNGKFYPRFDALLKLSNYFYVSADYLIGRIDDVNKMVPTVQRSVNEIHSCFIENLNRFLIVEKMSRYKLAKKLNIGQSTLSRWFYGNCMPESAVLIKIADLMGDSIDFLLGRG